MKKIGELWKRGAIALVPIAVLYIIGDWAINWFIGSAFVFTSSKTLNVLLSASLFIIGPAIVGWLLRYQFVRVLGHALTGWIPFVGSFFRFFFKEESPDGSEVVNKEVEFYLNNGNTHVKVLALATVRIREPEDWKQKDSPIIPWVMTIWATTPGVFTGPLQKVKESEVHYTEREVEELVVTGTSFGFVYEVKKWKDLKKNEKTPW